MLHSKPEPDLTGCDLEPITQPERIQPFGFLLAFSRDSTIVRASANLEGFLGISAKVALGRSLDSFVHKETLHDIRNRLTGLASLGGTERLYGIRLVAGLPLLDLAIHYSGAICVMEGEPAGPDSRIDAASLVRTMIVRLAKKSALHEFHRDAARQVRRLTGFGRVMIYQFAADESGEVVAEDTVEGMPSFMGLRYPASDIPVQARALYLLNSFRIIADIDAATVPLLATPSYGVAPLDMTLSVTRAVSPVHIEYLRNMGVGASLSVSIIVDGTLWGLIACHNPLARLPTFAIRTAAELFGQMYSMMLETRFRQLQDHEDRQARESMGRVLASIMMQTELLGHASWLQDNLRPLVHCDGIAVRVNGRLSLNGSTPAPSEVEAIAALMPRFAPNRLFMTDHIAGFRGESAAHATEAAGVLGVILSASYGDYILLFRRERQREVRWAGMPEKLREPDEPQVRLSPRKSFDAYADTIRGRSRPFTTADQRVAEFLRVGLMEVVTRGSGMQDAQRQQVTERQEILIAELNHRVKNILALIRGLITQANGEGGDVSSYVASLSGRVQALARAHDRVTAHAWGPSPLRAIFEDEIAAYVPQQRQRFMIKGDEVLLHPPAFSALALIVHELVTNCSKYGSLSANGQVEVKLDYQAATGLVIQWRESGGPPVAPPTRRGFGSVIIERVIPFDLQGVVAVRYAPAGLEAEFFIPAQHIASVSAADTDAETRLATAAASGPQPALPAHPLAGFHVLLVEDNLIVAMESEDMLRTLGAAVRTAATIAEASKILKTERVDFAVLDINLNGESSMGLAAEIAARQLPFMFASGYGENVKVESLGRGVLTLSKPYDCDELRNVVVETLRRNQPPGD
jgi:light-regulated signal transduction histidine kinase (bacteriophytochrome)/CheY-like chemotaxis protein